METLYENDKHFHGSLKVWEVLAKVTLNELQALKTRINGYDEDLDILKEISIIS